MKTSLLSRIMRVAENLYRDPDSGRYYGKKKVNRRQQLHSLDTSDRPTANRELKKWLASLEAGDRTAADRKLEALLGSFLSIRKAKAPGTFANEECIAKRFKATFRAGMKASVRSVRTSQLLEWLTAQAKDAKGEWRWSASYYNTVRLFLKNLFELAVADRVLDEATNPFKEKLIRPRKREKTVRRIPTLEQFAAIIQNVREQKIEKAHRNGGGTYCAEQSADFLEFLGLAGVGQAEAAAPITSQATSTSRLIRFSPRMTTARKNGKKREKPLSGFSPLSLRTAPKRAKFCGSLSRLARTWRLSRFASLPSAKRSCF